MLARLLPALLCLGGEVTEIPTPAAEGSSCPGLSVGADGRLRLSWIEPAGEGHALGVAVLVEGAWSRLTDAARGEDWFVNWADLPALAALADGTLAATFLEQVGEDTYAYGVRLTLSSDGGETWSEPVFLHDDRRPVEHGFVSLLAIDADTFAALWLDGRETGGGHGTGGGGSMTLRTRTVGRDGTLGEERLIDERVCDCCQTAAVSLPHGGALFAWRDRSEDELRDVSVGRWSRERVTDVGPLHMDGWRINGCPVNGPALTARGESVGAAWFTLGTDGEPRVLAALAPDGRRFGARVEIAGARSLGRVDAAFGPDGGLWVSWFESEGGAGVWLARRVDPGSAPAAPRALASVSSAGRDAGFGRLARTPQGLVFAWTETGPSPRVRTSLLGAR